jgi:hypothetical protein
LHHDELCHVPPPATEPRAAGDGRSVTRVDLKRRRRDEFARYLDASTRPQMPWGILNPMDEYTPKPSLEETLPYGGARRAVAI